MEEQKKFMKEAFRLAQEAYEIGEVPVGCAFVYNGEIVSTGRNETNETKNGTRHAELVAIDRLLSPEFTNLYGYEFSVDMFKDTVLYVTVEPCIMCSYALRQLNLVVVVQYWMSLEELPGYPSLGGIMKDEAILLLRKFYIRENSNAPIPKKKSKRVLKTDDISISDTT
ncbi:hypothetical protein BB560_000149 [Smittium megazygosporum]|uniref:CMP/dCMP-type deaminase domain-containing protein n=1 Tax=Smittium megazygosporum TaxID=133381 RepID=A0A2T9ZLA1_9FUNG|nr:hypothetical protein BB560_000149 [Smittium megazygosporum]